MESSQARRNRRAAARRAMAANRALRVYIAVVIVAVAASGTFLGVRLIDRSPATASDDARIRVLKAAIEENPQDINAHRELAMVYTQLNSPDAALREYRAVLKLDESDTRALYGAGRLYLNRGDVSRAQEYFAATVDIDPSHARAAAALADVLLDKGLVSDARAAITPALGAHPESAELHFVSGVAYERAGEPAKAQEQYGVALELLPGFTEARQALNRVEGR